jgi:hypothetical protein
MGSGFIAKLLESYDELFPDVHFEFFEGGPADYIPATGDTKPSA